MNQENNRALTGDVWSDVAEMQKKFGIADEPMNKEKLWGRIRHLAEELSEIEEAFFNADGPGVLDGLEDLVVVAVGTMIRAAGLGAAVTAWQRIMEANMAKEPGKVAKRDVEGEVDLVKPEGWRPPDLSRLAGQVSQILRDPWLPEHREPAVLPRPNDLDAREASHVLAECAEVFALKSRDYNGAHSSVKAADYFPEGLRTFSYIIDTLKRLRQVSVVELLENGGAQTYDGLEDILKDRIIYMAMAVEWIRGQMPGQPEGVNIFTGRRPDEE